MIDRIFTLPELASLVDVEYRTLHTWVRRGLLAASHQQSQGSGTRNLFDHRDAVDAFVLADLRRAGIELSKLEAVASTLRRLRARREPGEVLLINGRVSLSTYGELREAVRRVSPTLVYDLGHARSGLGERLELGTE
jgi:DNA-binding transcriptional MerR regulator